MAIPFNKTSVWFDSDPRVKIEVDCPLVPDWKTSKPATNFKTSLVSLAPDWRISCFEMVIFWLLLSEYFELLDYFQYSEIFKYF